MKCEELFAKIDELNEKHVAVWEDVCNIESPTDCKPGVDAAYVTAKGIPCVDSLGIEGSKTHSPEEQAPLRALAEAAKRIASVIYCF